MSMTGCESFARTSQDEEPTEADCISTRSPDGGRDEARVARVDEERVAAAEEHASERSVEVCEPEREPLSRCAAHRRSHLLHCPTRIVPDLDELGSPLVGTGE